MLKFTANVNPAENRALVVLITYELSGDYVYSSVDCCRLLSANVGFFQKNVQHPTHELGSVIGYNKFQCAQIQLVSFP